MSARQLLYIWALILFACILIVVGNSFGYIPKDLLVWGPIFLGLLAVLALVLFIKEHISGRMD